MFGHSRDSRTSDDRAVPSTQQRILGLAMGYQISQALYVAVRLAIPDHLSDGPRSAKQLATATHTDEGALYRVLRALASVGVFREHDRKKFSLAPDGETLCSQGSSIRDLVLWTLDPFHYKMYSELLTAARTGTSVCAKVCGMSVFEYFAKAPQIASIFDAAMTNVCRITAPAILEAYDFGPVRILVDVGGGEGALLLEILKKYPRIRGILAESPRCLAAARKSVRAAKLEGRCVADTMDLFQRIPQGGDTYLLKNVLHDWADVECIKILQNCRAALSATPAETKRILVIEALLSSGEYDSIAKRLDLDMLVLATGRERTIDEFQFLFAKSGFQLARVIPTKSLFSLIEAVPL
ncbi:MAG: methyltransferase [Candidatus Acidiferrales bacterium]